jgi:hypothetical protein
MPLARRRSDDGRSVQRPLLTNERRVALGCMLRAHSAGASVVLAKSKYSHRK